jgi:hypothetical protein
MPSPAFRLPGVYFAPAPRPAGLALPPLDVAAFVGFAERGPLDLPVAVDDPDMYRAIFGGDLALARGQGGRILNAQLPRAVAAFFANGGRRCYAVRVAGRYAKTVRCLAPGLVALDDAGQPRLTALCASSPGRWADALRLATRLLLTPLPPDKFELRDTTRIDWETDSAPQALEVGDLLRLTLTDDQQWLFPITAIERPLEEMAQARLCASAIWSQITPAQLAAPLTVARVQRLTLNGLEATGYSGVVAATGTALGLTLAGAGLALQRGDILQLELDDGGAMLFPIMDLPGERAASPSPPGRQAQAMAALMLPAQGLASPTSLMSGSPPHLRRVERLRFSLRLRLGEEQRFTLAGLAFNAGHSRFWGDIAFTESSPLQYRVPVTPPPGCQHAPPYSAQTDTITPAAQAAALYCKLQAGERLEPACDGVLEPRLLSALLAPLDTVNRTLTFLPLEMTVGNGDFTAPLEDECGDDDLALFARSTAGLFLDPYLFPDAENPAGFSSSAALLATAAERYYGQNRRLQGLHSLLFMDEVALVSAPDAIHPGWCLKQATVAKPSIPPSPLPPVTAGFAACRQPPGIVAISPAYGPLTGNIRVEVTGRGFMAGSATTVSFGDYPAWDVQVLDTTTLHCRVPPAGQAGPVTVEVCNANGVGRKTNGFIYQPLATTPPLPEAYSTQYFSLDDSPLLPVQQALLDFCQVRTDVVGILSLPAHFEKRQCIDWQGTLRQRLGLPRRGKILMDTRDSADLSYVAVYHPWLLTPDAAAPDGLSATPPDGAICGLIAARERDRQAWVAPANVPLHDVVDLSPTFSDDDWAELFALQFNLIRPKPRGFLTLSTHTLSAERSLLQLSARRLLILLRKLALVRGLDYVFADNTEALRNAIRLDLEDILRRLFEQGAFAGPTQPSSFRIAVGADLNPPASIEQGRLLVQIQVAPSQPLEFINVLLLRTGEGLLQAVEA